MDPGALVAITLTILATGPVTDAELVEQVPIGWLVVDAAGGTYDLAERSVRWSVSSLVAGSTWERRVVVRAPSLGAGDPVLDARFEAKLVGRSDRVLAAPLDLLVAPELVIAETTFATIDDLSQVPTYLTPGEALDAVAAFDRIRLRFQVRNPDSIPVTIVPDLEYRAVGDARFVALPAGDPARGVPFYLATEWRPAGKGKTGTVVGPPTEPIPPGDLKADVKDDPSQRPSQGRRFMGTDPEAEVIVPANSYTEIEFTLRASIDAPYGRSFELRLVDDGRPVAAAVIASLATGPRPPLVLTPGQRNGLDVGAPVDAGAAPASLSPTAARQSGVDHALLPPDRIVDARSAVATGLPRYRLAIAQLTEPDAAGPLAAPFDSPHVPDTSLVTDTCARCHSAHTGQGPMLLPDPNPQSSLCLSCHDGSGSDIDVAGRYADQDVPANDEATRSTYRHDALAPSVHTLAGDDEFGGLLERHSECADCHNPHNSVATDATQTTTGWTVSGRQAALSGVAVTNGPAGTAPTYAFLDGSANAQPTREYEICLKCHSGYTVLPSNVGQPPSRYALDKGLELNPGNASYHPVEAAGTNQTAAMANGLAGTSPYKLWDFTTAGTVRCVNCHADPAVLDPDQPPTAGSALAPHVSQNRGLLLQPYRDRSLKPVGEPYSAADFALCYVCHSEAPYLNIRTGATAFDFHALHVSDLPGGSGGLDIDTPGAGQGYAVCAECHFRLHSTAQAVNDGDRDNSRLVNFAPNVVPNNGVLEWQKVGAGGTCTLTCHGEPHRNADY